jgi:hypothetical protein
VIKFGRVNFIAIGSRIQANQINAYPLGLVPGGDTGFDCRIHSIFGFYDYD